MRCNWLKYSLEKKKDSLITDYNKIMIKDDKRMADYAKVIVKVGVNVQKGQPVVVGAIIEAAPLVHHIVEECYKAGASKVLVRYDDAEVTKLTYLNETIESLQDIPQYQIDYASAPVLKEGACRISIRGSSPDLLKSIELKKIQAYQKAVSTALKPLSNWTMSAKCQ
jgi:aminopeptidase